MATRAVRQSVEAFEVFFINADQGGWRKPKLTRAGTTVSEFLSQNACEGDFSADNYQIRVNREAVDEDYELQPGDVVSMTARKIEGALNLSCN